MTLPLHPAMLAAAYEYLRATPPFRQWKLPPADEVEFHVTRHADRYGDHNMIPRPVDHCIRVSARSTTTTDLLLQVMAHEMIHAHLVADRLRDGHGANFMRAAKRVCAVHGWDLKGFV